MSDDAVRPYRAATEFFPGGVVNEHGDLWGNSPLRVIRHGHVSIAIECLEDALAAGWIEKPGADAGFARVWRSLEDRPA